MRNLIHTVATTYRKYSPTIAVFSTLWLFGLAFYNAATATVHTDADALYNLVFVGTLLVFALVQTFLAQRALNRYGWTVPVKY